MNWRLRINSAGSAADASAGSPLRSLTPFIGAGVLIDNHERETKPIGNWIPRIIILEIQDLFIVRIEQTNTLAGIIEGANVLTGNRKTASITSIESGGVFDH